jgi:maleamate amidohydrolase
MASNESKARVWDRFLTDNDRKIFEQSGYGAREGYGEHPCLLVVDVTIGFVGDESLPVEQSNQQWPDSCGEVGWAAVAEIRTLLDAARAAGIPVIHTTGIEDSDPALGAGRWADKNSRWFEAPKGAKDVIVSEVAPIEGEVTLAKGKPSAFAGTPLSALLVYHGVDSLLVAGTTTSGCVRATVVDAFSHNYKVSVVEDCVFDRGEASHAIALLDMDLKYADVVSLASATKMLGSLDEENGPA